MKCFDIRVRRGLVGLVACPSFLVRERVRRDRETIDIRFRECGSVIYNRVFDRAFIGLKRSSPFSIF